MNVRLRQLKPNPLRDFEVDPIDEEAVARLATSIKEDGFWGGVVCRKNGSDIEIAAGHHRVDAAIRSGIEEANLFVAEGMDDATMIRIYARENSTQRGTSTGTARAGSVAAALRMVAHDVFTGDISRNLEISARAAECAQGNAASVKGIGADLISRYLAGIPSVTTYTVQQDLGSLKASGDYARIIGAVRDQIVAECAQAEREAEEARCAAERAEAEEAEAQQQRAEDKQRAAESAAKAQSRAETAADKAAEQEITFDFKGVAAHLKAADHIKAFRDKVTSEGVAPYVPFERQAELAQRLVGYAEEVEQELSGYFIRSCFMSLVARLHAAEETLSADEESALARADWQARYREQQNLFLGCLRSVDIQGRRLKELLEQAPDDAVFYQPPTSKDTVQRVKQLVRELEGKL